MHQKVRRQMQLMIPQTVLLQTIGMTVTQGAVLQEAVHLGTVLREAAHQRVYGGTTPGVGLDCSGLVQYCYAAAGISLPRTSAAQGGSGIAVTDPQPGDIVCYSGHVGIYIGNGQMIHAPQTGDVVKISDVYGSPWYRRCW